MWGFWGWARPPLPPARRGHKGASACKSTSVPRMQQYAYAHKDILTLAGYSMRYTVPTVPPVSPGTLLCCRCDPRPRPAPAWQCQLPPHVHSDSGGIPQDEELELLVRQFKNAGSKEVVGHDTSGALRAALRSAALCCTRPACCGMLCTSYALHHAAGPMPWLWAWALVVALLGRQEHEAPPARPRRPGLISLKHSFTFSSPRIPFQ